MKQLTFIILLALQSITAHAQTSVKGGYDLKEDTIAKEIVDHALYRVFYDYSFVRDAAYPKERRTGMTLLQIGKTYTRFIDYYSLRVDSIVDDGVKNKIPFMQYAGKMQNALRKSKFKMSIVTNRKLKQQTVQQSVVLSEIYQYQDEVPEIDWAMAEGDSLIAGYACKKATCRLYGRDYIVWYAPKIHLPYGPYKFSGLPGLIFYAADTEKHYTYTLAGLQQVKANDPIYVWKGHKVIKSNRNEVRQIYKNYCANPAKAIMNTGKSITISSDVLATIEPLPYNPIERE
jgi:GLPGLI family protein